LVANGLGTFLWGIDLGDEQRTPTWASWFLYLDCWGTVFLSLYLILVVWVLFLRLDLV